MRSYCYHAVEIGSLCPIEPYSWRPATSISLLPVKVCGPCKKNVHNDLNNVIVIPYCYKIVNLTITIYMFSDPKCTNIVANVLPNPWSFIYFNLYPEPNETNLSATI